jgi:hypothetical protein
VQKRARSGCVLRLVDNDNRKFSRNMIGMEAWEQAFGERFEAGFTDRDPRTVSILDGHALLERELDEFFAVALPKPDRLRGLGFGQKVSIWSACLALGEDTVRPIVKGLVCYNDLRNSIAHGDKSTIVDRFVTKLCSALPPAAGPNPSLEVALHFLLSCIALTAAEHLPFRR